MNQIFTAKSINEAKAAAAQAFGINVDDITFEILEEPKKGFLGIIKGQAKVNAVYEKTKAEIAVAYIKNILDKMEIESEVKVKSSDESSILIEIEGNSVGTVIGRRGETLDALQYLASMVTNKNDKEYLRITVDSCGYREKRKETLEELAIKIAETVQKTGRTSTLEPMNPYERRIIHSAVSSVQGVASKSVGEEPYRKVVISSTVKKPERNTTERRPNTNKRRDKNIPPRSLDLKTSFEKDYIKPVPKPKPEDEMDLELYGKINNN